LTGILTLNEGPRWAREDSNAISSMACSSNLCPDGGSARSCHGTALRTSFKVGTIYVLNLKLLNARLAMTVRHISKEIAGNEELLIEAVRQWGANLVDPSRIAGVGFVDIEGTYAVAVDGSPAGDGPLLHYVLQPGEHLIQWFDVNKQLVTEQKLRIAPYTVISVNPRAQPAATTIAGVGAILSISSTPSGAEIAVDGHAVGQTPMLVPVSAGEKHAIRLVARGFAVDERTVTLLPSENRHVEVGLVQLETGRQGWSGNVGTGVGFAYNRGMNLTGALTLRVDGRVTYGWESGWNVGAAGAYVRSSTKNGSRVSGEEIRLTLGHTSRGSLTVSPWMSLGAAFLNGTQGSSFVSNGTVLTGVPVSGTGLVVESALDAALAMAPFF
jgi:hypothetical protein